MYANPNAVKTAISGGATYSGGRIVEGGVAKWLKLVAGVWTLDAASGVPLYNKTHYTLIKNNVVLQDPGEYQFCLAAGGTTVIGQLAQVNVGGTDYAMVIDP